MMRVGAACILGVCYIKHYTVPKCSFFINYLSSHLQVQSHTLKKVLYDMTGNCNIQ